MVDYILRVFDLYVLRLFLLYSSFSCRFNISDNRSDEYGPCIGVPRLLRWERAHALGLNPPQEVRSQTIISIVRCRR